MTALLLNFALVNDAAAATPRKLEKQRLLGDYFRGLDEDDDLRLAVRYARGRAFAATDERTLNVGGSIVSDVAMGVLKSNRQSYYSQVARSGEVGEALAKLWPRQPVEDEAAPLLLRDLEAAFERLAKASAVEQRKGILRELLVGCRHPREAAYVAKIIFGEMRTGVQEGVLQGAIATGFGRKLAEVQRCQLLAGDLEAVAVLARHDALHTMRLRLFHPIQFMLATPQETAEDAARTTAGRGFRAEDKLDGIRAQVHKSADATAIFTRTMDRADESFPDVVAAMAKLPGAFLLDGEIVPWCDGCVLPFAHIQRRLGRKRLSPALLRENPVVFIAFDILYRDGELLLDEPLARRREALAQLERDGLVVVHAIEVSDAAQIQAAFDAARLRRNEGIVLKDPQSIYSPGRRGQAWLKLKTHLPTLDCVVTAAEYGHGKRRQVLSDYTFAVWDRDPEQEEARLVNVGKAFTGLTDEEIAQLTELFLVATREQHGRVHVVEPKIVLEIACDQIQKSKRHASGYAMRFPRIKRIRWDKKPADADRLPRVREIYDSGVNFARQRLLPEAPAEPGLFDHLK